MQRDPTMVGRTNVMAETFAGVINSFVDPISWKTMVSPVTRWFSPFQATLTMASIPGIHAGHSIFSDHTHQFGTLEFTGKGASRATTAGIYTSVSTTAHTKFDYADAERCRGATGESHWMGRWEARVVIVLAALDMHLASLIYNLATRWI